ncbi:MAG: hypothetical protein AAF488_12390 [Planctomycetota bacterium]
MSSEARQFMAVVLGATALACGLGIALDLVTANVAVGYFSIHHRRVVDTESPWILAIVWGIGASWWFGAIAGALVGFINHRREEPLEPRRILRWVAWACVVLWVLMIAVLAGVYLFAGTIPLEQQTETFEHDRRLIAVAMAHQLEYALGAVAFLVIAIKTWRAPPPAD